MGNAKRLRLRLFGHLAVEDQSRRLYLPRTRKTKALLAILALSSPKPVLRLTVAPDQPPGTYLGMILDRAQAEQRGTLRVSVTA